MYNSNCYRFAWQPKGFISIVAAITNNQTVTASNGRPTVATPKLHSVIVFVWEWRPYTIYTWQIQNLRNAKSVKLTRKQPAVVHVPQKHRKIDIAMAMKSVLLNIGHEPITSTVKMIYFSTLKNNLCFCPSHKQSSKRRSFPVVFETTHRRSQGGPWSKTFLAYIVILCFERQYLKQNSVIRLKSNILAPHKILGWLRHWNHLRSRFLTYFFADETWSRTGSRDTLVSPNHDPQAYFLC